MLYLIHVFWLVSLLGAEEEPHKKRIGRMLAAQRSAGADPRTLLTSHDPDKLAGTAINLARSKDPQAFRIVLKHLEDGNFLNKLDSNYDYHFRSGATLRIMQVLRAIGRLPPNKANAAFLKLANSKVFLSHHTRTRALLVASAEIREPSKKLLDFLDAQSKPKSAGSNIIIDVLGLMRSPEACKRIEKRFYSADYPPRYKVGWFTASLLPVRNDPAIVALYKRLLSRKIEDGRLRNAMVLSLFDYRPGEWYGLLCTDAEPPPPRRDASTAILKELLVIADLAVRLDISDDTRKSVKKAQKEIKEILAFRHCGGPERITKLIRNLDDNSFHVRAEARQELARFGDWAEPALRKALEGEISLEVRMSIEMILKKLK